VELFLKEAVFMRPITNERRRLKMILKRIPTASPRVHLLKALTAVPRSAGVRFKICDIMSHFFKFWFPVIFYFVIIFYVSGLPNLQVSFKGLPVDKFFHILEYSVAGCLLARALHNTQGYLSKAMIFWGVVLFCSLYGLGDEIHQSFVVGRSASWGDLMADALGGLLGGWGYGSLQRTVKLYSPSHKEVIKT
jgi:hypothetical protein